MSFGKKVDDAVRALKAEGRYPPNLRPVERNALVIEKLINLGRRGQVDLIVDGVDNFETRYVVNDAAVWARPVGIAVAHDGALLVSEDGNGTIWRVSYRGGP